MKARCLLTIAVLTLGAVPPTVARAATYFKLADEWGTIMPNGPRSGVNGIRFWNAEGSNFGNFSSTAPFRFYTSDIVAQANAEFGEGQWEVANVNIVLSQSNASFTAAGGIDLYWFSNDDLQITNGENDGEPGQFAPLGVSPLRYQAGANPLDTSLSDGTVDPNAIFGDFELVDSFQFTSSGVAGDWPLDVLAPREGGVGNHLLIDPENPEIVAAIPSYAIAPPIVNPERPFRSDTLANFEEYSERVQTNLDITSIAADIEAGANAVSFILVADSATAATYKGNPFGGDYPARIYIEIVEAAPPGGVDGDFNDDGIVDAADYVVWRANDGSNTALPNDGGLGTPIQSGHYDLWAANFGLSAPGARVPSDTGAVVPEPSTLGLLFIGFVALCPRRRASRMAAAAPAQC